MRKINFRAKYIATGEWQYFSINFIVQASASHIEKIIGNNILDIKTLGEYIGLKDKNGVEIYEGDILKDESGTGQVVWLDSGGCWAVSTEDGYFYPHCNGKYQLQKTEVIGDIYQNSKLLGIKYDGNIK